VSVVEVTTHGGTRRISNVDSPGTYEVGTRNYRQSLLLASKLPASRVDRTPHRHEARACFSFVRRYYEERAARADICATPASPASRSQAPTVSPRPRSKRRRETSWPSTARSRPWRPRTEGPNRIGRRSSRAEVSRPPTSSHV